MATENPNEQKPSANSEETSGPGTETTSTATQPSEKSEASNVDQATSAALSTADEGANQPTGQASASASEKNAASKSAPFWLLLLVLILAGAIAALGYLAWHWQQQQQQQNTLLRQQLQQQSQQLVAAQQQLVTVEQGGKDNLQQWTQSLGGLEQRLESHSRRLRSLSTTTRDDWLLAEAEYLVRLANQRLQMERGPKGALALLQSADQILLELDDAELFPVRDKLQRDITALKLTPNVDRSGLYLQLAALADEVLALPQVPRIDDVEKGDQENIAAVTEESADQAPVSLVQKLQANFLAAMSRLGDQVRVRHHDQPLEPLLPPDGARYLRENLRFNIEQAQLAMLREETDIYRHSLTDAEQMLRQYFATQERAQRIADQLAELKTKDVQTRLPGIGGSLTALQEYTDRLHRLDARAGSPQLSESPQPQLNENSQPANPQKAQ